MTIVGVAFAAAAMVMAVIAASTPTGFAQVAALVIALIYLGAAVLAAVASRS